MTYDTKELYGKVVATREIKLKKPAPKADKQEEKNAEAKAEKSDKPEEKTPEKKAD